MAYYQTPLQKHFTKDNKQLPYLFYLGTRYLGLFWTWVKYGRKDDKEWSDNAPLHGSLYTQTLYYKLPDEAGEVVGFARTGDAKNLSYEPKWKEVQILIYVAEPTMADLDLFESHYDTIANRRKCSKAELHAQMLCKLVVVTDEENVDDEALLRAQQLARSLSIDYQYIHLTQYPDQDTGGLLCVDEMFQKLAEQTIYDKNPPPTSSTRCIIN